MVTCLLTAAALLTGGSVPAPAPVELVIVGTVHRPTRLFNPDSVAGILERVRPDLILVELDSSFFTPAFELKQPARENEDLGVARYRRLHPRVPLRPFDIEGRNEFHRRHELLTRPGEVLAQLDALYQARQLTPAQGSVLDRYYALTDSLNRYNRQRPGIINRPGVYALAARRQHYHFQELRRVVEQRPELTEYRAFCRLYADFWDQRNRTMARHIRQFAGLGQARRIVVLVGHAHKYYLLRELAPHAAAEGFRLREYYHLSPPPAQ
ncbi:hypothetical protein EJV47_15130 [Hymenobacter gummosus]|uniref:TraB/GumN family protein n=1 Tax=Hymenobacter gummosus TaxID=1776032 RepID=A0A431U1E0_9BACT|nr:hypothetical protein [Hymenobacter gummosus]RTQ48924.1 hypothetical protein EJV47_15130 [Hymenobacter gummosus]